MAIAAGLLLPACSDQPTEITPNEPSQIPPIAAAVVPACPASTTLADILNQINQVLPRSPIRTSLIALVSALPSRLQDRIKTTVRRLIFPIVDLILRSYNAGQFGPKTPTKQDQVYDLIRKLYCYVGLTPPDLPSGSGGTDIVVAVVFPNSPTTTISVPSGHAAVQVPTGAAPTGGVTIVVRKLPDSPPPLLTTLNQYPFFYEYSGTTATGPVTFNLDVTVGICLETTPPPSVNLANLRVAHNVGTNFGDVEVLPPVAGQPPGINCSDLSLGPASDTQGGSGLFAWGGWNRMARTLAPVGRALLPEELHAATVALATAGVGGTTKKFSPFGIVDQTSNPASIQTVDQNGNATDGVVTGPGTVYVKATSRNGSIIAGVPVTFDETTVFTGSNGIASFNWTTATPGATLTASVPNQSNEVPPSCPSDIPTPNPVTGAYRPLVCFTPSQVTFRDEAAGPIGYGATGYRYFFPVGAPPEGFEGTSFDDSSWLLGNAAFGFHSPANPTCTLIDNSQTLWAAGSTDTPSLILLRRRFTLPGGPSTGIVSVAIDNDVRVFVNGTEITNTAQTTDPGGVVFLNGFVQHEGCPTRGSFTFTASNLNPGVNLLVIMARDRGGSTYIDAEVTAAPPPIP
jgi:hypothetical protein